MIDRILAQPATAPFIAAKVVQHFVTGQPSTAFVNRLGDSFRHSKYDMKTLMRDVFTSPEFSRVEQLSRAGQVAGGVHGPRRTRARRRPVCRRSIAAAGSGMGQTLFDPPDVGGWPNNEAWISSNTVIERVNFVTSALAQTKSLPLFARRACITSTACSGRRPPPSSTRRPTSGRAGSSPSPRRNSSSSR